MNRISRRRFLQLSAMTGGALLCGDLVDRVLGASPDQAVASAAEPIKIGILDPLSSPYKTSSIHDVHGANVAVDLFNKRGGVLGRPVAILEADDASNTETAIKAATKFVRDDRVAGSSLVHGVPVPSRVYFNAARWPSSLQGFH